MNLRCFLFSTDEATAEQIRQAAAEIQIDTELCSEGFAAIEQVSQQTYAVVIVDWSDQPEAGSLLTTARQRKATERPLTLAIVGDDASVPKALQAGANSILRKPVILSQVTDTLTTARDLLRARQSSAKPAPAAPAAMSVAIGGDEAQQPVLRAGEFLQSAPIKPGGQFETDEVLANFDEPAAEPVDALKELEPVASTVDSAEIPPEASVTVHETRGLEWYLKARGVGRPNASAQSAGAAVAPAQTPETAELLGYEQTPSHLPSVPEPATAKSANRTVGTSVQSYSEMASAPRHTTEAPETSHQNEAEPQVEQEITQPKRRRAQRSSGPSRWILLAAMVIAIVAMVVPQAPWHNKVIMIFGRGQRSVRAWLNPQPVLVASQAPLVHEDFARPGDEYKLPSADPIPDATTDPSQIRVVPEVDPTAKKPAVDGAGAVAVEETSAPAAMPASQPTVVETQPAVTAVPDGSAGRNASRDSVAASNTPAATAPTVQPNIAQPNTVPVHADLHPAAANPTSAVLPKSTSPTRQKLSYVSAPKVPSSLQSQMAVATPDPGGNRPVESAMPSIEPVVVPELAERALLADQPAVAYPASAKTQQGTVTLQVLIGRDGTVQDAKFLQGSFVFAKAAIDGVRQWKFKPYIMNGRPVSVQTNITVGFKPGS